MRLPFVALTLFGAVAVVNCFPEGAPVESCDDLTPGHEEHVGQTGRAPYSVTASKSAVRKGGAVTVTIRGLQNGKLKGFLMVALQGKKKVGQFLPSSNYQLLNCTGNADGVTHKSANDKSSVAIQWRAPQTAGNVVFKATIVKSYEEFWENVRSSPITVQ